MSKNAIELIYSQQSSDYIAGRAYSNPRFFSSARSGVSKVFIVGDWPNIEEAYTALGIPVEKVELASVVAHSNPGPMVEPAEPVASTLTDEERAAVEIPADWADLSWSKPNDDGVSLRGLASKLSATAVLNKADAIAAIQAELDRREFPQPGQTSSAE